MNWNWLGRLWNRQKSEVAPAASRVLVSRRKVAGQWVTNDNALQNATVWACVQYLTGALAQLPWHVMKHTAAGGSEPYPVHPAEYLLNTRPCPDVGSFSWRQSMLGMALMWGNAYAEIERDMRGAVYALWPIHPERVTVRRAANGELEYEVWNYHGGNVVLAAADMFHVRGFGDGPVGYNVIEYAAQSIGWAQATEAFGVSYFGEGMNPSGIVEMPQSLSPAALELLKATMKELYTGPKGSRTAFFDAGMKFQKITNAPEESQFIETRQHQVEEICRWFGVPPHKVMHLLRATFSNIEHQSIEVVVDSITPWVKRFEEEANYKIFGLNRQGLFTKMNLNGLLRGDSAARAAFYKVMFELGVPINHILGLEDINGIGPDGDVSFVSNNVQTLKNAIVGKPLAKAPPATPDEEGPADDEATPETKARANGIGLLN